MANTFITIQEIARNVLPRLIENLVFPNLVHKDFSNDFSRSLGDTIQVRRAGDSGGRWQTASEKRGYGLNLVCMTEGASLLRKI